MKKTLTIALLLIFFKLPTASAMEIGAGIVLGIPSGITANVELDKISSVDAGLAFAFDSYIMVWSDYLYHFPKLFGTKHKFVAELIPYLGGGGVVVFTNSKRSSDEGLYGKDSGSFGLGVRIPVGVEWKPSSLKWLGVYVELAPGLSIIPKTEAFFQGGIGARYYF